MPAKNPRIQVTLSPSDLECINLLSKRKGISKSSLIKKMVEDWLEDYEEMLLAKRADDAFDEAQGKPIFTSEEVWKKLDL